MGRLTLAGLAMLFVPFTAPLSGQLLDRLLNPDVTVRLEHPPSLPLRVKTVAFGPPQGQCSESLHDRIESDFYSGGVEVVDRQHLENVLAEHKLQVSGLVESSTAARVGAMLGAQALVFLKVLRCDIDHDIERMTCTDGKTKSQYNCSKYTTKGTLAGSLRVVDLTSGRYLAAQPFQGIFANSSMEGYPDNDEVLATAESNAASQIHRMFFPWHEQRELVFFNDKDCNLKTAFQLVRGQDYDGALGMSIENLELCKTSAVKPKVLMHAYHNVGMAHFIRGEHEQALSFFGEALRLGGGEIVATAMADCRRAQKLTSDMARYEEDRNAILADLVPAVAGGGGRAQATPAAATRQGTGGGAGGSVEERLRKLDTLLKQGLITQDDYRKKKAEILSDL